MFLEKYLDDFYYEEVINNYNYNYLSNLNELKFIEVVNIFRKYNFNYIEDIILSYIEIFEMGKDVVEENIIKLRNKLGVDFVKIISKDLSLIKEEFDI